MATDEIPLVTPSQVFTIINSFTFRQNYRVTYSMRHGVPLKLCLIKNEWDIQVFVVEKLNWIVVVLSQSKKNWRRYLPHSPLNTNIFLVIALQITAKRTESLVEGDHYTVQ